MQVAQCNVVDAITITMTTMIITIIIIIVNIKAMSWPLPPSSLSSSSSVSYSPSCGPKQAMTPQSHSGLMLHTVSGQGTVHHMTAQSLSSLMQHTDGNGSHLVLQQGSSSLLQH